MNYKLGNLRDFELQRNYQEPGFEKEKRPLKRVRIEAMDMDWLFQHDNSKLLINMLAEDAELAALTRKPIKIFI